MAVITRTECYVSNNQNVGIRANGRMNLKQGKIMLFLVLLLGIQVKWSSATPLEASTCNSVKNDLFTMYKIRESNAVLDQPSIGHLCGSDSCCTESLEKDLLRMNKQQVDNFLRDSITKFSSVIDFRARKFDALFKDMMNNSKRDFHQMFHKTYGKIYLQNSDVFINFFTELETYYKKGTVRLSETLEQFFGLLYQRMFTVINSQYEFDEKYLICATEHMIDLNPFGDVPKKLTMQLRRSFVATRTYYKSLVMAAETAKKMLNIKLDEECEKELFKMQSCGVCKGLKGQGTCSEYCTNVLETCLKSFTAFSGQWDNFIDSVDKVADRLVGPFNIEMVVEPLNIKISEAVMIFQENGADVSKKIFLLCGKPKANRRRRRSAAGTISTTTAKSMKDAHDDTSTEYELKYEPIKLNGGGHGGHKKKNKKNKANDEDEEISELEKLIKEIKMKMRETRQFWAHLPYSYCNNQSITAPPSSTSCWNDKMYPKATSTGKLLSAVVNEQIFNIQALSDKMRKAYQGEEVEIVDDSEDILDAEGSGSGDDGMGSGDFEIDADEEHERNNKVEDEDFNIINKIPEEPKIVVSTKKPPPGEDEEEDERENNRSTGGSSRVSTMSLQRALLQYLLPIVLIWFGGAITDLL